MAITIQRIRRGAAGALMLASVGACAGNLGNILGGVLGNGGGSSQLSGTIRGVDSRYQQISIQTNGGQTVPVSYDNQTQVVYQNQNYSPTPYKFWLAKKGEGIQPSPLHFRVAPKA